ncbi:serine/threonine-protein kinase [Archangium lansingense]|uniref:Protein kinase n=1 Tax=Archangium lansingense TaxID=2995310 RepID=A0ABT4AI12_9BACT|nr:serine/threonine-protein kinase [Archangium lansinium]MCY1080544.1 protein kinase [Archangium lansinium]
MSDEEQTAIIESSRGLLVSGSMGSLDNRTPITTPGISIAERRSLEPGMWVTGRYLILEQLGQGGMGRIWLAEDTQEQRRVALKVMQVPEGLPPGKVEELVLMFRHEFFAMKRLQHPGTLKVFDCGLTESGHRFITMEAVDGQDLSRLAREQVLDTRTIYRVLIQMAQVLAFIHSRLYVHCDIKASNVRITGSGAVKLMDFGVMHQLGTPGFGRLKGTLEYLAPEWQRGACIDGRADLYSLGVMAFFLATRQLPFKRDTPAALLAEHLFKPVPRPSSICAVEPQLEEIILMLLAKDPRERFQDASELLAALCHASGEPLPEEPLAARASYLHVPEVVGRQAELELLLRALQKAGQGQSRAVLLGAPAGVGKSRLLQEFELQAQLSEVAVGVGQCRAEGLAPLAPIAQALRMLVPRTPKELMERLGPLLGKLVPALSTGPAPTFRDPGAEKMAVFGALAEWLLTLGQESTFVLCIEDLHWADTASLEVLNVIIRSLHQTRGMVVATFRSNELNRLSLAFETVDQGLTSRLELAPLTAEHLDVLVRLVLPGLEVPAGFVDRLHAITGGNAFFATECLRMLVERGALLRVGGRWTVVGNLDGRALPESIREAVLVRLANLPEEQVALLRRLAPAGRSLELPLVRALADLSEADLFQALDELVERQFLQRVEGRCVFTHDTVHESLHESTPEAERRAHHGRIAEILQQLGGNRPGVARAVGYHFTRSNEPQRAVVPLLRAGHASIEAKALLDATLVLKEAAALLEAGPRTPERVEQLIRTWVTLIEIGYVSDPPTSLLYAEKLFAHWAATVDLAAGRRKAVGLLAAAIAAPETERSEVLRRVIREIPLEARMAPAEVFWKQAELQILQSIAQAIMGRTTEFHALLERVQAEHPVESPYRSGALIARGALSAHTGRFAGVVEAQRTEVDRLRAFRDAVAQPPRRLAWALGMGCYFLNMNLALRGEPLDAMAMQDGFDVADTYGFTDIRIYHLQSQIVRASFIGDASAFVPPFSEKQELIRRLGHPRLPERNLAIYTPPYYLERGEHELVAAVVARGEQLAQVLPGDRWLKLYVLVYSACRDVLFEDVAAARESLPKALEASRAGDFRMETLVRVYQSRFERAQGRLDVAREAAEAALRRALDPVLTNPFDEILARRALAPLVPVEEGDAHLTHALALAEATGNVLQAGLVHLAFAERWMQQTPERAGEALDAAENALFAVRAGALLPRVEGLRATQRSLRRVCGGLP